MIAKKGLIREKMHAYITYREEIHYNIFTINQNNANKY